MARRGTPPETVIRLRKDYWYKGVPVKQLATQYEVSVGTVSKIINGKSRSDVGGPKASITVLEARQIRELFSSGEDDLMVLAEQFEVSPGEVLDILLGVLYPSAGGPLYQSDKVELVEASC